MRPISLTRQARAALAVAATALCGACGTSPGGPHYAQIGITTSSSNVELAATCLPLPVLPGGTIEKDVTLASSLTAHVFLVRDYADVTLEGTNDPYSSHVQVPLQTLLAGYVQDLSVTAFDGRSYVVTLESPCNAPM